MNNVGNFEKVQFRFETLEIWKEAISISMELFKIADMLEAKKLWRFADQIRGVGISIPNNISESTGSTLVGEQRVCLRVAIKECYEAANMMIIFEKLSLISSDLKSELCDRLAIQCKRTYSYSKSLK